MDITFVCNSPAMKPCEQKNRRKTKGKHRENEALFFKIHRIRLKYIQRQTIRTLPRILGCCATGHQGCGS